MNKKYLKVLKRLKEKNIVKATIPELDIELELRSLNDFALMINNFVKEESLDDIDFGIRCADKEIVQKAFALIRYKAENQIYSAIIIGDKKEEAFGEIQKHIAIVDNEFVNTVRAEDHILVNFKYRKDYSLYLKSLSSIHVTIIEFGEEVCNVYQEGLPELFDIHEAPAFENFVNSAGYFIDEYLIAQILYEIHIINQEFSELLLENLNTQFVLSLPKCIPTKDYGLNRYINKEWVENIIDIVQNIPLKRIENYDYDFVEAFLHEKP